MEHLVNTKFYHFRQNNTGVFFETSEKDGISESVIIEALNANHANDRAEEIGLYFDCCKDECYEDDRWIRTHEIEGYYVPCINGKQLENIKKSDYINSCFIHYLDSNFKKFESTKIE